MSSFGLEAEMTFQQMLKRLSDDDATVYVVTREPKVPYHEEAVEQLAATKKANIKFLPTLHTKLYCASTAQGDFALLGSANFTEGSLYNRELGLLVTANGAGATLVRRLALEAAEIYRTPESKSYRKRQLVWR
jgi:hypothetical protein